MGRIEYAFYCCLCCCGGLPIIALIKAAITIPLCLFILTVGNTLTSVVLLPHDIFLTYRSLMTTETLGCNIKIGLFLLLPIPLLTWPIWVVLLSTIVSIFYPLGVALLATFSDDSNLCIGGTCLDCDDDGDDSFFLEHPVHMSCQWVGDFWDFNYHNLFGYLEEVRCRRLPEGEKPFDIPLIQVVIGLCLAVVSTTLALIVNSITFVFKFPLIVMSSLIKIFVEFCKMCADCDMCTVVFMPICLLFVLAAWPLYLTLVAAVYLVFAPLGIGLRSAVASYQHKSTCAGLQSCWYDICLFNGHVVLKIRWLVGIKEEGLADWTYLPHCGDPRETYPSRMYPSRETLRFNAAAAAADFDNDSDNDSIMLTVNVNADCGETLPEKLATRRKKQQLEWSACQKEETGSLRVSSSSTQVLIGLPTVYDLLFVQIENLIVDALNANIITNEDVMAAHDMVMDHWLCTNVVSAVAVQLAVHSLSAGTTIGPSDLLMSNGTVVTAKNRPGSSLTTTWSPPVSTKLYKALVDIKTCLDICSEQADVVFTADHQLAAAPTAAPTAAVVEAASTGSSKDEIVLTTTTTDSSSSSSMWNPMEESRVENNLWPALFAQIMKYPVHPIALSEEILAKYPADTHKTEQAALMHVLTRTRKEFTPTSLRFIIGFRRRFQSATNKAVIRALASETV